MDDYIRWHGHYWHMGVLFDVIVSLGVLFGIVCLYLCFVKSPKGVPIKQDAAIDTLKKRYAAGEIGAEEFIRKKKDLES